MSETPSAASVPPRKSPAGDKPVEDKAANAAKSAADTAANEVKGFRARVRAIRNDSDVKDLTKDAKPFLAGAAVIGGAMVDPVLTATVVVNRVGRRIQTAYRHTKAAQEQAENAEQS